MEALSHTDRWQGFLKNCSGLAVVSPPFLVSGSLTRVTGLIMEATGLKLAVGSGCTILIPNGNSMEAEVVGFHGDQALPDASPWHVRTWLPAPRSCRGIGAGGAFLILSAASTPAAPGV